MYLSRDLEKECLEISKEYPVLMVIGPRQVGKTTMLNHIKPDNMKYISLDNISARLLAENDPALFFETYGTPLMIDEFQRVPSLLLPIKEFVDSEIIKGNRKCFFWLTGSQKFLMHHLASESLAGRVGILDMYGLSKSEIEERIGEFFSPSLETLKSRVFRKHKTINEVYQDIFNGSMPRIVVDKVNRERYYENYINTYLEKDIRELSQVANIVDFYNLLVYVASRTASSIVIDRAAKELKVSVPTVNKYLSIMETTGIIYKLQAFSLDVSSRIIKNPKYYFLDTGLCCYLAKYPSAEVLMHSAFNGAIFETYVIGEIIKKYSIVARKPILCYYRDKDQKEIDLIIIDGKEVYPIEIKRGINPSNSDKNFNVLLNRLPQDYNLMNGLVICNSPELIPINRYAWYCPLDLL